MRRLIYGIWQRQNGEVFSETAQQSISKSRNGTNGAAGLDARTANLRASSYVISYDSSGSDPDLTSITLTAESFNFEDAYQFTGGDSNFGEASSQTVLQQTLTQQLLLFLQPILPLHILLQ